MAVVTSIETRNRILSNLAASDAFHDFNTMGRLSEENRALKANVLESIWPATKEIGTLHEPTSYADEEETFANIIGKPISEFKKVHAEFRPLVILAGPDVAPKQTIEYEWRTVEVSRRAEGGSYTYTSSAELFRLLADKEDVFYFMLDAINVNFYAALIEDKGDSVGRAVYISTRERTNDSAGNRDLTGYVERSKQGSKIRLEILRDLAEARTNYTAMTANSSEPTALFNSIYTLSLENKITARTKEGLDSSILTFKTTTGATLKTVTTQSGIAEHANTVNSLYGRLVNFFKSLGAAGGPATQDYFIALQQKRSGDWFQVLSTFLRARYGEALEPGVPIYLGTEDRLCALYGLLVGANIIYTHQQGEKGFITIFRRKGKRTAAERQQELLEACQASVREILGEEATSLEKARIVPGGLTFEEAAALYTEFMNTKFNELSAAAQKGREAALAAATAAVGQRFNVATFDAPLKAALLPLYTLLLFVRAFPINLFAFADVRLTFAKVNKTNLKGALNKVIAWRELASTLRDIFATVPTALRSADEFRAAAAQLYALFEASNRERDEVMGDFTAAKPLYEQTVLGFLQQLSAFCPQSLLSALHPIFASMLAVANGVLSGTPTTENRKRATTLRMNAAILEYLLLNEATNFPAVAIPSFTSLLAKTFERPSAVRKGNLFAVHRIMAAAYKDFIQSQQRKQLIDAFLAAYTSQAGGARTRIVSRRKGTVPTAKQTAKTIATILRKFKGRTTERVSGSLERSFSRSRDVGEGKMSSLVPLYLVARILNEFSYSTDVQPYECVPRVQAILATLLSPEFIERAHKALAPKVSRHLFEPFYAELVGHIFFVILPHATHFPAISALFPQLYLPHIEELGRILAVGVLGDTVSLFTPATEKVFEPFTARLLSAVGAGIRPDTLKQDLIRAIRIQEGYTGISTRSRERTKTRRRRSGSLATKSVVSALLKRMSTKTKRRSRTKALAKMTAIQENAAAEMNTAA